MIGMVWFREDLRTHDHHALHFATRQCTTGTVAIYIIDHAFLKKHAVAACRVEFILRGLADLSVGLAALNIPLLVEEVKATHAVAPTIAKLMRQCHSTALFFNRQYEIDELRRDCAVQKYLQSAQLACYSYDDQVILPPGSVRNQQGGYYRVFTPYQRAWRQQFAAHSRRLLPAPRVQPVLPLQATAVIKQLPGYHSNIDSQLWPAGEKIARRRLQEFIKNHLADYDRQRNFPAFPGTSRLSPYLATGMISARQCFFAALKANKDRLNEGCPGALTWMSELIWREFYKQLLIAFPRVSMNRPYQLVTDKLPWCYDKKLFSAWSQGQTGIPIIDAAMRQLNTTGWMHNRLRMIVAVFLTKNLLIDWRWGENYFMSHLIDGDLAANNGGWQWCASTGVDAVPYFRVFNPITQSKRFDPDGEFIRQYCPELSTLTAKQIHDPAKFRDVKLNYPKPMVDLEKSRRHFIALYKKMVLNSV